MTKKSLLACLIATTLTSVSWSSNLSKEDLLKEIKKTDAQYLNIFNFTTQKTEPVKAKIIYELKRNANLDDFEQGTKIETCQAHWDSESVFIDCDITYDSSPVYKSIGDEAYRGVDYDPEKNLVCWRESRKLALMSSNVNEAVIIADQLFLNTNGVIIKAYQSARPRSYSKGSRDAVYTFNNYLKAVGRNYAHHLDEITRIEAISQSEIHITAKGTYGPSLKGEWQIVLDASNEYIMRKGGFFPDHTSERAVLFENEGVVSAHGLLIAKKGVLKTWSSTFAYTTAEIVEASNNQQNNSLIEHYEKKSKDLKAGYK